MLYRFGDFEIDPGGRRLRSAGRPVPLEPKVFDLLSYLIRHRDRVVGSSELLEAIWPGVSVSPEALRRVVMQARKAVHDDGRSQRVLRTMHSRGYRFVAFVDGDDRRRVRALLRRGRSLALAGRRGPARRRFRQALEMARREHWTDLWTKAALGFAGPYTVPRPADPEVRAELEDLAEHLPGHETARRAQVLARLAAEEATERGATSRSTGRRAIEAAKATGDPGVLARVLLLPWCPSRELLSADERMRVASHCVGRGVTEGDPRLELAGRLLRLEELLTDGRLVEFDPELAAAERLGERIAVPGSRMRLRMHQVARALIAGEFERAARGCAETFTLGHSQRLPGVWEIAGAQTVLLSADWGSIPLLSLVRKQLPVDHPVLTIGVLSAWVHAELGDEPAARRELQKLRPRLVRLEREPGAAPNAAVLTRVCSLVGERSLAQRLESPLLPHAGRLVAWGLAGCHGPADYYLALLALLDERWEEAEQRLASASQLATKMEARPWLARIQHEQATMLAARGDHERARRLARKALGEARALGVQTLGERARSLLAALPH